jgi:hypothetical protein
LHAQWNETFDSYTSGQFLTPQSDWKEWRLTSGVDVMVTTAQAWNGPNSILVNGSIPPADDVVYSFSNMPNGRPLDSQWILSCKTYVATGATGVGFVIMLNTYPSLPLNWSLEVQLDADNDLVQSNGIIMGSTPLIRDQWVPLTFIIDLDNDEVDMFYGGNIFVADESWVDGVSGGGTQRIAVLDLYGGGAPGGITEMYVDHTRMSEHLLLDVDPRQASIGNTVTFFGFGGAPVGLGMIFVTEIAGSPTFLATPARGFFDPNKKLTIAGPLLNSPGPVDIGFTLLGVSLDGSLKLSNQEIITLP